MANLYSKKLTFNESSLLKRYESENNILAEVGREEKNAYEKIKLEIENEENEKKEEDLLN